MFVFSLKRKFIFEQIYFVTIDNLHWQYFHEQKVIVQHYQEEAYFYAYLIFQKQQIFASAQNTNNIVGTFDGVKLERYGLVFLIHFWQLIFANTLSFKILEN